MLVMICFLLVFSTFSGANPIWRGQNFKNPSSPVSLLQGPGSKWEIPKCNQVTGTGAVTFTRNNGKTLAPTSDRLHGVAYTFGLAALDEPNTLLGVHQGTVLVSKDSGCTWTQLAQTEFQLLYLTAAKGGKAYGWHPNAAGLLLVTPSGVTRLKSPVARSVGLGVDPQNGSHLRIGGDDGAFFESFDSGQTWELLGHLTSPILQNLPLLIYQISFDPHDLDHILVGTATLGALVTQDGGRQWQLSRGFSSGKANVFTVLVSPADSNVVWAMGINLVEADQGALSGGRHVYRSENGGLDFSPAIDASRDVTLINGPVMAAHPTNRNVLYFVFGTFFQNYGTDLFRYNHRQRKLKKTHNKYHNISSIAFSPADPKVMYLGLTVEEGVGRTDQ